MAEGLLLAGRYRLSKQLGSGGMGSVWRAEDLTLGAEVAIKLIDPAFAESPEALARFRREAQAAAAIRSTYVVQILDHGIDKHIPYIAMELLKGESLAARLERDVVLAPARMAHVLGQVARALSLAHEHGIVHRDLKPDNIFLVREGEEDVGKVLDFGIARQQDALGKTGGLKTSTGAILGTPYYMSPEQATGQGVDHRSDIWSFGAIACECLTGRRVFDGDSLGALFHSICMAPMPVPSQQGTVPAGFDAWFERAVTRDREARYQSIQEASDDLRAICGLALGRSGDVAAAPGRGDTVASNSVVGPIVTGKSVQFGITPPPAAQTIRGTTQVNRLQATLLALPAILLVLGGTFGGWYWWQQSTPSVSSALASAGSDSSGAPVTTAVGSPAVVSSMVPTDPGAVVPVAVASNAPTVAPLTSAAASAQLSATVVGAAIAVPTRPAVARHSRRAAVPPQPQAAVTPAAAEAPREAKPPKPVKAAASELNAAGI